MCCCSTFMRCFFGITLILRVIIHVAFACLAANDLTQIQDATTWAPVALKVGKYITGLGSLLSGAADLLMDTKLTLLFYIMCGVLLFLAVAVFPWRNKHRPRLPYYAVIHLLFVVMVVYMVYVRGLIPLKHLREVYEVTEVPYLFPIILALDAMTILSACVPPNSEKPRSSRSNLTSLDVMPLVHGEVVNLPTNGPHCISIKAYP